jgi:hypothetical protein
MKKMADCKDNILFRLRQPGSAIQLAIGRILTGLYIYYLASSEKFPYLLSLPPKVFSSLPTAFPAALDRFAFSHINELVFVVKVSAVLFVLGFLMRIISIVLFVSTLLLLSTHYMSVGHTQWPYICFLLLVFIFARSTDVLSLDKLLGINEGASFQEDLTRYRWPVEAITLWFAQVYVAAGIAKLTPLWNGALWWNGQTIQNIVYQRFLISPSYYLFGKPFFNYAERGDVFWALLGVATLLVELVPIFLLFTRRLHLPIFMALMGMHFFIYIIGVGDFTIICSLFGFFLLDPNLIDRVFGRLLGSSKVPAVGTRLNAD